ncbi:MAG: FAD-dependent oxidoreductase, partial [Planctomycetota bacterium]
MSTPRVDVLIIGGGPAGSCAAIDLARRGYEVAILEKAQHPRFHVGESLLPNLHPLFDDLGLTETLDRVPKIIKRGAEIVHAEERGTGT